MRVLVGDPLQSHDVQLASWSLYLRARIFCH